ncbi:MAG: DNA recombination protein RmuC [Ruminococcus sp.]|nr:DNA recombination protein RmuC [Ruminococcus sp.]
MDTVYVIIGIVVILLLLLIIYKLFSAGSDKASEMFRRLADTISESNGELRHDVNRNVQESVKNLGDMIGSNQRLSQDAQTARFDDISKSMSAQLKTLENRFASLEQMNEQKMDAMRNAMTVQLTGIREDNSKHLDSIQKTVNEKLDARLNDSFKLVSERLEQVYKGLGEMQTVAASVGDLKKVLSNVKNRGTLGEIQLGAILNDLLAPEQYLTNTKIDPNSRAQVEFAVKLPGGDDGSTVLLPIDSKFPGDRFAALQDANENGSPEEIAEAKAQLLDSVKRSAKDIHDKYIVPPYSTNFAIMFLPFEGLYAEVVNSGLVDQLRREYSVSITGPSTMAALLNSLQMGFRTLAIQKRSNEVWALLSSVKTEFGRFAKVLEDTQKNLRDADSNLEKLVGIRTRKLNNQLIAVEALPQSEALSEDRGQ